MISIKWQKKKNHFNNNPRNLFFFSKSNMELQIIYYMKVCILWSKQKVL